MKRLRQRRNRNGKNPSVSHDEAMILRLRRHPDFAAAYLKAALEESDEPRVLLIALCHVA